MQEYDQVDAYHLYSNQINSEAQKLLGIANHLLEQSRCLTQEKETAEETNERLASENVNLKHRLGTLLINQIFFSK